MGYKLKRTTYNLKFSGTDYDGLEIEMGTLSIAETLEIDELTSGKTEDKDQNSSFLKLVTRLSKSIISWNLEDDNGPVAVSYDAILEFEVRLVYAIVDAWVNAMTGVSAPLDENSTSGDASLEASLTMENS